MPAHQTNKPFIGVHFNCCSVYGRVYLTADRRAFAGHCPRCATPIRVRVESGGSKSRFYRAG